MFFMVMLLLADCEDIFTGGHGFGMRKQGTTSDHWIDEFYYWLEREDSPSLDIRE